ncbi:helix-turn-helix domain-containing protein [Variovorax fucosicus]|uniref:helix-turn-helix domain-containing protein n=1 Tax=Variovorax fucosicus TaxID=3053517 RepID=UPI0025791F28|nr:XRE family transcriptional regulator [Variovorax sp. J22G47]MDM0057735.1 XRE family transcriptional regulator [Variovorax sp. J22G47]
MPVKPSGKRSAAPLDRARMGERLREIRKGRRLTLKALSERSGVALSTLSKIELGQISVSYEKFAAVARALEVDIAQLFDPRAQAAPVDGGKRPVVVRSTLDAAPGYDSQNYDYRMLATDFPGKRMTPLHGTIVARALSQFPDFIRHAGQEFVMVLSGSVRIHFETGEAIELKRQESAYFDSGVGHIYLSTGKADAQVVVVMAER